MVIDTHPRGVLELVLPAPLTSVLKHKLSLGVEDKQRVFGRVRGVHPVVSVHRHVGREQKGRLFVPISDLQDVGDNPAGVVDVDGGRPLVRDHHLLGDMVIRHPVGLNEVVGGVRRGEELAVGGEHLDVSLPRVTHHDLATGGREDVPRRLEDAAAERSGHLTVVREHFHFGHVAVDDQDLAGLVHCHPGQ